VVSYAKKCPSGETSPFLASPDAPMTESTRRLGAGVRSASLALLSVVNTSLPSGANEVGNPSCEASARRSGEPFPSAACPPRPDQETERRGPARVQTGEVA